MALLFYAAMVSTLLLYVFNLVVILVALLGWSATKLFLPILLIPATWLIGNRHFYSS